MPVKGPTWREFNDVCRENEILRAELNSARRTIAHQDETQRMFVHVALTNDKTDRWARALDRLLLDIRMSP
jgi:hypothetical protein